MKSKRITLINVISNIILQITNIVTWFVIPRIILKYFGSDVNGLISSITQFLSYITLVEGGISAVVMASLYKPLVDNDTGKVSSIIKTSQQFYKKIGVVFIIYSILLAILYPLIFDIKFSFLYVSSLVIILSIGLLIQYMFSLTYRNLLNSDKKGYVVSLTQSFTLILTIVLSYVSVKIFPSIHVLKFISGILFVIQPAVYGLYVNKKYTIDKNAAEDTSLIKQRWNGFAINIAAFIHNSTDVTILTILTDFATVSVYSVYSIVTSGLRTIINSICSAIVPTIGISFAKGNQEDLNEKMDMYEYIIFIIVFFSFSIAGILITPFVLLYTSGVNDANYNQVLFGILLVISEALYLLKMPHLSLSYSANKFKELTKMAFIEAAINVFVSLILVHKYGIVGVAIGTICGMSYRMIEQVKFTKNLISSHSTFNFYKKILLFSSASIVGILACIFIIPQPKISLISWIFHAILYSLVFDIIYALISIVFFKKEVKYIYNYMKRGKK